MARNLTEVSTFSTNVTVPANGDDLTLDSVVLPIQQLANRTRKLQDDAASTPGTNTALAQQYTTLAGTVGTNFTDLDGRLKKLETTSTTTGGATYSDVAGGLWDASYNQTQWNNTEPMQLSHTNNGGVVNLAVTKQLELTHGSTLTALKVYFTVSVQSGTSSQAFNVKLYERLPGQTPVQAVLIAQGNGNTSVVGASTSVNMSFSKTIDRKKLYFFVVTPFVASSGGSITTNLLGYSINYTTAS